MASLAIPDSVVGKESACSAGGPSSIPGSGRSAGEGMGHPRQDSWASVVAQLAKNFHFCWGGYGLCLLALVLKVSLLWGGGRRLDCSSRSVGDTGLQASLNWSFIACISLDGRF